MSIEHREYSIHGLCLRVESRDSILTEAMDRLLVRFERLVGSGDNPITLSLSTAASRAEFGSAPSSDMELACAATIPPGSERPGLKCSVFRSIQETYLDFSEYGAVVMQNSATGRIDLTLFTPWDRHQWARDGIFVFVLRQVLRKRGVYALHAACVERDGAGVIFCGPSGSGKSTCSVAMGRGGYTYLTDDCAFFQKEARGVRMLSFPHPPRLRSASLKFFPECESDSDPLLTYGIPVGSHCTARVVLFPVLTAASCNSLEPISKTSALALLLPQSLLVSDIESSALQFEALSQLVASAQCYHLQLGANPAELPGLVSRLLSA